MKIGGFQELTLSDFPGHVAAIVFTQGCNLRCPFCHNVSLIFPTVSDDKLVPEGEIFSFLTKRQQFLDGVVITGGEPTLQRDLMDFMRKVKSMGLAVKLDTNGSMPEVLEDVIHEDLVDYIAMDIKAPLKIYKRLTGVEISSQKILKSIELIADSGISHEFRTTVVEALLSSDDIDTIRNLVPPGSKHRLQAFKFENVLNPSACCVTVETV